MLKTDTDSIRRKAERIVRVVVTLPDSVSVLVKNIVSVFKPVASHQRVTVPTVMSHATEMSLLPSVIVMLFPPTIGLTVGRLLRSL